MGQKGTWLILLLAGLNSVYGGPFGINDKDEEWKLMLEQFKSEIKVLTEQKLPEIQMPSLDIDGHVDFMDFENRLRFLGDKGKNNKKDDKRGWPYEKVKFYHPVQSPVDIITSKAVTRSLPMLDIIEPSERHGVKAKFFNSGSNVYIKIEEKTEFRPYLIGGPLKQKYMFKQLHFHWGSEDDWGSEHFVDGESFAVEIHVVYFNSKYSTYNSANDKEDGLAVLTIFAEAKDEPNQLLEPLHKLLPNVTAAQSSVTLDSGEALQWAASALTLNTEYYTYPGSLTTKPFSENVVFIILPKPITLSHEQLQSFREIEDGNKTCIVDNKRKLQPLHNRPIVRGTDLQ